MSKNFKQLSQQNIKSCSICGSLGTTKTTCPKNPNAINKNYIKHPNLMQKGGLPPGELPPGELPPGELPPGELPPGLDPNTLTNIILGLDKNIDINNFCSSSKEIQKFCNKDSTIKNHLTRNFILLNQGSDIYTNKWYQDLKVIKWAIENGFLDVIKVLVERGYRGFPNDYLPLAAAKGYLDIVKYLLENYLAYGFDQAIVEAAANGHVKLLKYLLSSDYANSPYRSMDLPVPIGIAAEKGYYDIVKILLEHPRIKPTSSDFDYAVAGAAAYEHFDILDLLLKDPRIDPKTFDEETIEILREINYPF